jgi:hypothetical protein
MALIELPRKRLEHNKGVAKAAIRQNGIVM